MSRRLYDRQATVHRLALSTALSIMALSSWGQEGRPNVLWLVTEDISPHLGAYGYRDAVTPNLDKLAAEGVTYTNAFVTAPVCAVTRSALLTGIQSSTQGTHHMRNEARLGKDVKTYPSLMRSAGYFSTNPGKTDYQGLASTEIWDNANSYQVRPDKTKPFLHVDNHAGTHEGKVGGVQTVYDPGKLSSFPPYYPDTPKARRVWAKYYANIHELDKWVKERLDALKASGEADNTIVFFYSDHGAGLPRAKRWVYDSGLRIPLIVRVPPKWQSLMPHAAGTQTDELVTTLDFAPTLLKLAGAEIPAYMQGRPFLGKNLPAQHQYVHGHRDRMDERHDIVRTVRDKRFRYIRNYEYFKPHLQFNDYPENNAWSGILEEIRRVQSSGNAPPEIAWYFQFKEIEELYDTQTDPHEMKNLARDPAYRDKLLELRSQHLLWRKRSRDLGAIPEGILLERRTDSGSEYDYGREKGVEAERAWEVLDSLPIYPALRLGKLLEDPDPVVRYWASIGLGNLAATTPSVIPALDQALEDASPWVRIAAARGLLLAGDSPAALDRLKALLQHSDWTVQHAAMVIIDESGSRAASLKSVLQTASFKNAYIDLTRIRTMATLNDPILIPPLPQPVGLTRRQGFSKLQPQGLPACCGNRSFSQPVFRDPDWYPAGDGWDIRGRFVPVTAPVMLP